MCMCLALINQIQWKSLLTQDIVKGPLHLSENFCTQSRLLDKSLKNMDS